MEIPNSNSWEDFGEVVGEIKNELGRTNNLYNLCVSSNLSSEVLVILAKYSILLPF